MKDQCCNHDCNQGRNCPVRDGTHKPAEAVHQIQEPTVNQQLTIEREAFEKWLGIKPCGAAHDFGWSAWKARAALAATPADHVEQDLNMVAASAPVVLPEPVPTPCRSMFATQREYADAMAQHRKNWAEIEAERALLATGGQAQAVEQEPFGYFKAEPFGWTDCGPDDEGAVALYERPQAQAGAREALDSRAIVEKLPRYTYGYKSDEWGMGSHLQSYQDTEGKFLKREEVIAAIAAAKGKHEHI